MAVKTKTKKKAQPSIPTDKKFLFDEISVKGANIYKTKGLPDYNPDDLVGKKGLDIYKKMLYDDQVKAVLTMKKFARLMTAWEIQPASSSARDKEIAEFVKYNIKRLQGTFEDNLLNILTALEYGYSITEEVWYRIIKGRWAGKIGLEKLKTREPFFYLFDADEFGNLKKDGIMFQGAIDWKSLPTANTSWFQRQQTMQDQVFGVRFPVNKFVIYSYNKEFSNHYGKSDLRAAYRSWWSKEVLIRFMNIYMERFGMPTHVGKYPKGTRKEDKDALKEVLDRVQSKYSITIPEDISIDLLDAAGNGEVGYSRAIEMHNRFIARSILVPDLLGFTSAQGGGSYALGKKHFDVFLWMLKKLGKDVEETIVGEQIIKRLVDLNYANIDEYPRMKFEDIAEEGTQTKAMIVAAGVQSGFINPEEEWIRSYLALPKVQEGLPLGLPEQKGLPSLADIDLGDLEGELPIGAEEGRPDWGEQDRGSRFDSFKKNLLKNWTFVREEDRPRRLLIPVKYAKKEIEKFDEDKVLPTKFDKKFDYKKAEIELNEYENDTVNALSEIFNRQKDALVKDVLKKRILEDNKPAEVNKLQLKFVGDLKKEIEGRLVKLFLDSKLEALKQLIKGGADIELKLLFAETMIQKWKPIPPRDAIDFFNRKVLVKIVDRRGVKKFVEIAKGKELSYYSAKAFAIAGVERENILQKAKGVILEGLKTGDWKEVIFNLESLFDGYLQRGEIVDADLVRPHRLETIVRTNFSEALNAGRKAMYEDEDVKSFVPYWQYSAILDSRVRKEHAAMHGRVFRSSDPIWDKIYPPNGFNCRCTVAPITKYEVDEEVKSGRGIDIGSYRLPANFPDRGFHKFSEDIAEKIKEVNLIDSEVKVGKVQDKEYKVKIEPKIVVRWEEVKDYVLKVGGNHYLLTAKKDVSDKIKEFKEQGIDLKDVKLYADEIEVSVEEELARKILKCPYKDCPATGDDIVEVGRDDFHTVSYRCKSCRNGFKITKEGDLYLYDKVNKTFHLATKEMFPSYMP